MVKQITTIHRVALQKCFLGCRNWIRHLATLPCHSQVIHQLGDGASKMLRVDPGRRGRYQLGSLWVFWVTYQLVYVHQINLN